MKTVFRIYIGLVDKTGRKVTNGFLQTALDEVARNFQSFTVINSTGYWKGDVEPGRIIEIVGDEEDSEKVNKVAAWVRNWLAQECVMVTKSACDVQFI